MRISYFDTSTLEENPIFSKTIHIKEREKSSFFYLDGFITYKGVKVRVHRVTDKKINKSNKLWLERNLHQTLWELSDFYKEIQQQKFEIEKQKVIPTIEEFGWKSINMNQSHRKITTQRKVISWFKNHILPKFGKRKIDSIKPSEFMEFQTELIEVKKLSPKTFRNIRSVFYTIIEDCINDEIITKNPLERVKLPKRDTISKIDPFVIDEVTKILQNVNSHYKPMFVLSFFSGMRWGEILGLQWKDVDFKNDIISVTQTISMGEILNPKTKESERDIEMLPIVKEYLLIQKSRNLNKDWVFVTTYGNHYQSTNNINQKMFKPLLDELDIKYRPIKHTRHTFASIMLSQNEDILWVSKMMGHTDKSLTLNVYSKYVKQPKIKRGVFTETLSI